MVFLIMVDHQHPMMLMEMGLSMEHGVDCVVEFEVEVEVEVLVCFSVGVVVNRSRR